MSPARAPVAASAALAALIAVAGCSSAGPAPGRSGGSAVASPSSSAAPTSTAPATPASSTVAPPSATASPTSTAPPPPSAAPTTPPAPTATAAPRSTCRSLTIRVIRGSAAPGYEFAALQFVNTGTTRCVLNGYPTVTLLRGGAQVGRASAPEGSATSRFVLAPGATAESRLKDFSSCQAPISDQLRVVAPGSSITSTRPGQLRACTLRVSALTTPE